MLRTVAGRRTGAKWVASALVLVACAGASPRPAPVHVYRPLSGTPEIACVGVGVSDDRTANRTECASGNGWACRALLEKEGATDEDAALAQMKLERRCAWARDTAGEDPSSVSAARFEGCMCFAFGSALAHDREGRFDRIALDLLDEACVRGVTDACDEAVFIAKLCAKHARPMCDALRAQGRAGPTVAEPPRLVTRALPATVRGCFTVSSCGRSPAACALGASYCFDADRISFRARRGPWDQAHVAWSGYEGTPEFQADGVLWGPLRDGRTVTIGDASLIRAPELDAEVANLPRVEEACARAAKCAHRRADAGTEAPSTLLGCLAQCR